MINKQLKRRPMKRHAREALYYTLQRDHSALFLDMRLNKSSIFLKSALIKLTNNEPILIVAPSATFESWIEELKYFGIYNPTLLFGDRRKRLWHWERRQRVCLTNYESNLSLPEIAQIDWGSVCLDESTTIKAPPKFNRCDSKGKRPNISKFYTENFRNVKHRYILTGTPMPESELDIYMQLNFLDPNILPFKTFWEFRLKFFINMGYDGYIISSKGKKYLNNKLKEHCFFASRKTAGVGGDKLYRVRKLNPPADLRRMYKELFVHYILKNKDEIFDVTDSAGTKYAWARRLCGGFLHHENGDVSLIWRGKLDEVLNLITGELKDKKIVIWSEYTCVIHALYSDINSKTKRYAKFINGEVPVETRISMIRDFRKSKFDILIAHPRCLQFGANLSSADYEIFYDSPLGYIRRAQAEDRIISQDKVDKCVIDLIAQDTLEEEIYESIKIKENKNQTWHRVLNSLRWF